METTRSRSESKLYQWARTKATSTRAPFWIGLLFVLELFLFIPLDPVLLFFCLQRRQQIFLYTTIAAIASVLSAMIGYLIGHLLWDLIGHLVIPHLISIPQFDRISLQFQAYEHWAFFLGALFPFPLKALSLTAGVFHLGLFPFTLFVLLARLLRFFLIGGVIAIWGEKIHQFVERYFNQILMIIGAKVGIVLFLFWLLSK